MAKVKLARHRVSGPLLLRRAGNTYALTAQEDTVVPLGIAIGMLGDEGLLVELDSTDSTDVLGLNEYNLTLLKREFGLEGDAKAVKAALFPPAKKTFIPNLIKETPVEETPVVEEPVAEEPEEVEEEAIDYSQYTVKQLKEMLEEKGLSTDGKKADLVERMSGAE
mgnify:CR=1 FL=1|tara:strand:- start:53 stop:547 length:495 start_codon:yes stop_codon:yes gene_type:complete